MQRRTFLKQAGVVGGGLVVSTADVGRATAATGDIRVGSHYGAARSPSLDLSQGVRHHAGHRAGGNCGRLEYAPLRMRKRRWEAAARRSKLLPIIARCSPSSGLSSRWSPWPADHAPEPILAALESGCHVVAEKPACVRASDFERAVRLAESKQRNLMLAFANRRLPPSLKARELVKSGMLGKLYAANMYTIADQTRLKNPEYHKAWYASKARPAGAT